LTFFFTSDYSGQVQVDGTPVRIQLMDTAGQVIEQFHFKRVNILKKEMSVNCKLCLKVCTL